MRKWLPAVIVIMVITFISCKHHHSNNNTPSIPNPANYTYNISKIAEYRPGFFSICFYKTKNEVLLGTYEVNNGKHEPFKCQLCKLNNNQIYKIHRFSGESIYHIRKYENYVVLAIEKGNLYRYDSSGIHLIMHKRHEMGFYDFTWSPVGWFATEIKRLSIPNHFNLYRAGNQWLVTDDWMAKEVICYNNKLYLSARAIDKQNKGGIAEVDFNKNVKFSRVYFNTYPRNICIYEGAIWEILKNKVISNTKGEEWILPNGKEGWCIVSFGKFLFATTGGKWRDSGPGFIYVFDVHQRQFKQIGQIPDAELWGLEQINDNKFLLITRNENRNIGRIYKIEVSY